MGRSRTLIISLIAGAVSACLSGCAGTTSTPTCGDIACTGVLNGAAYEVVLPQTWNGTLVIYSHGYRNAQPIPPQFAPVNTLPEPAPGWASGNREVGDALLAQGYAIAGSAYAANGWAVREGVEANADLVEWFTQNVGEPRRVLAWGDSLGGLITAVWAQGNRDVDGVLAMCAPLAGVVPNMELSYLAAAAIRDRVWPELPISGFASYDQALAAVIAAGQVVAQLADLPIDPRLTEFSETSEELAELDLPLLDVPTLTPDPDFVLTLASQLGAPAATRQFDGTTKESQIAVAAESLVTAVTFGTLIRYELALRSGGEVGDPADRGAREVAMSLGEPSGDLVQPTIALHTIDDPVTIAQNVSVFTDRVQTQGALERLQAWFTAPPDVFAVDPGAPFGAGHCNFAPEVRVAALAALDGWVESGAAPAQTPDLLGSGSGYQPGVRAPAWPLPLMP